MTKTNQKNLYRAFVIGLISNGDVTCGPEMKPDIFAAISGKVAKWIKKKAKKDLCSIGLFTIYSVRNSQIQVVAITKFIKINHIEKKIVGMKINLSRMICPGSPIASSTPNKNVWIRIFSPP